MWMCACHTCTYTHIQQDRTSLTFNPLFLLLLFPLCNKNVNWNKVFQEICDYVCVWVWMRVWTLCVLTDLRAFPIILPHILPSIRGWFTLPVCVCVCLCDCCSSLWCWGRELGLGRQRKVINFYLLWRFNHNFTNKRAHANQHTHSSYKDTQTDTTAHTHMHVEAF